MIRVVRLIAVLFVVLLSAGALTWFLAFRVGGSPPDRLRVIGLEAPATVRWRDGGDAFVELGSSADLDRALGAVHMLGKPWPLLLLRQAALGRLSEWYGRETLSADHLVRRLGLPVVARRAWDGLADGDRRRLEAYADGVNAALASRRVRLAPAIATMDVEPDPWEPWHALAVERLVAWLGTDVSVRTAEPSRAVDDLLAARDSLSGFLGIGGLEHGAVWHLSGQPPALYVRWVVGTTGISPVTVVAVRAPGVEAVVATWLGMPARWAGRDADRVWAVLPYARAVVEPGSLDVEPRYERLRLRDGSRDVVVHRADERFASVGDAHRLAWPGLAPVSDLPAIDAIASGTVADFRLLEGLTMTMRDGDPASVAALGPAVERAPGVVLVSGAPEAAALAAALAAIEDVGAEDVLDHAASRWARDLLEPAREAVVPDTAASPDGRPRGGALLPDTAYAVAVRPAVQFLRNWDYTFDGPSIGATLFDGIVREGPGPGEDVLRAVVDSLRALHGSDVRTWRWERTAADLVYPGYVARSPYPAMRALPSRYAPVAFPRHGHPTAPAWGSARPWVDPAAPAAWEGLLEGRPGGSLLYRRPHVPFDRLLGRFSSVPEQRQLHPASERTGTGPVTRLVPREP